MDREQQLKEIDKKIVKETEFLMENNYVNEDIDSMIDRICEYHKIKQSLKEDGDMEINILGIPYKVKEVDLINNDENILGLIIYEKQKILLKKSMKKEIKKTTLIHEVIHGILLHSGYSELNEKEDLVDSLSNSIYQVLKGNKELITYFS